ncbi:hypothetical protein V8C44DRAFT_307374 [Trichoderma aethiopicum]
MLLCFGYTEEVDTQICYGFLNRGGRVGTRLFGKWVGREGSCLFGHWVEWDYHCSLASFVFSFLGFPSCSWLLSFVACCLVRFPTFVSFVSLSGVSAGLAPYAASFISLLLISC